MKVLLVDNYDSFVYNLAQYVGALGAEPIVIRNDVDIEQMQRVEPDAIVISPGPGHPIDAGRSIEVLGAWEAETPILGVCLGHQAIGVAFGAEVVRAEKVMHGKTSLIHHFGTGVFSGLPAEFEATRYHSLVIEPSSLPKVLEVTASTDDGVIMGVRHVDRPIHGVQFHPESVSTGCGMQLIENFLKL